MYQHDDLVHESFPKPANIQGSRFIPRIESTWRQKMDKSLDNNARATGKNDSKVINSEEDTYTGFHPDREEQWDRQQ